MHFISIIYEVRTARVKIIFHPTGWNMHAVVQTEHTLAFVIFRPVDEEKTGEPESAYVSGFLKIRLAPSIS